MLEVQINPGDAAFLNQALDLAIALLRRAARNRDDYDDPAIEFDDFALLELGFLRRGRAERFQRCRHKTAAQGRCELRRLSTETLALTAPFSLSDLVYTAAKLI